MTNELENEAVIIDAGTLSFNEEDLTATGLLVPFGVKSRSNLGEFTVDSGVFSIPSDVTGMSLNIEHQREDVVGAVSKLWEQPEGIFSTFKYADTDEGRKAFAEAKDGTRKNLSAEVASVRIQDGKAVGGRLFAAAQVAKPAFAGATLLAAEDTPNEVAPALTAEEYHALKALLAANSTSSEADADEDTNLQPTPAGESINNEETLMATDAIETAGATVPATLLAAESVKKSNEVDLGTVFASIHAVKTGDDADAATLLAALADITTGAHVTSGAIPATFAGKLWQGKRYQSRYIDLLNHTYGNIPLGGRKGFKLAQGTALGAEIASAGQKVELPTGTATTSIVSSTLRKYGFAADFALEWEYLEGGSEVLQAFFEGVIDSIAKLIDEAALTDVFYQASRGSGAALSRLVAPGTFPTQYAAAMGQLIQGIDLISDNGDDASFAIVNPIAWNQLLFTPKDLVPEFIEFGVGVGTGEATAGKVRVVKAPQSFFAGTVTTAPQVIVGAKNAIEFREQHIEIDALEVAKFGVDRARVAFLETFVVRPESLSLIGTKP